MSRKKSETAILSAFFFSWYFLFFFLRKEEQKYNQKHLSKTQKPPGFPDGLPLVNVYCSFSKSL